MTKRNRKPVSPEYTAWLNMKTRCLNPKVKEFRLYGGRGITVCERWSTSFADFLSDMGPRPSKSHSIERIDVNGNYEPQNCFWATRQQQSRNKRNTKLVTYNGVTKPLVGWSDELGISMKTLWVRLKMNWDIERAFTRPVSPGPTIGERRKSFKLTPEQVKAILVSTSSSGELARQLGVNKSTIQAIRNGATWRHVEV